MPGPCLIYQRNLPLPRMNVNGCHAARRWFEIRAAIARSRVYTRDDPG